MTIGWDLIANGVSAPEGPTLGPGGWVLSVCSFTRDSNPDVVGGDIVATHPDRPGDTRRLFNTSADGVAGIPAALAFGPDGAIYITDEGHRAILRATDQGVLSVYARSPNGPNDLSFDREGNLWFTDPWGSSMQDAIGGVYVLRAGTEVLTQIASGLAFPNGIVATQEELVYAETRTGRLWRHRRSAGGRLGEAELFAELPHQAGVETQGPDGVARDIHGNLYVAHFGAACIRVLAPDGTQLDPIAVPGRNPTNLCFGGPDMRTLFVTLDDTDLLVAVQAPHQGSAIQFCPSADKTWAYESWLDLIENSPAV
ncbi:SMP-30/gluconolactonase/LRE family protein [Candidatus Poriferisocius sp.]|uniref:SMP-30/gluconolactonase/LRE family protein n=1 Tax=Candidatus Poriferisocius sp. TaxID=3101276 RepID=UPI003B51C0B6